MTSPVWEAADMLECVVNISEGVDDSIIDKIARRAGDDLLDVHTDPHHNRSVLTLVGEDAPRAVTEEAVARLDLRRHRGVHPRIGVVDVVPFVPLGDATMADAESARERYCDWAAENLGLPCFTYGSHRTLPHLRREAFVSLTPDRGPTTPHPTAGAVAVGARPVLVAFNVWLASVDLDRARTVAATVRSDHLRALGLQVGDRVQVSMNLIDPEVVGPADVTDRVAELVGAGEIVGCELVGLLPRAVLERVDPDRWIALDLSVERTIEHRLSVRANLSG
ncbi:MAG: hypothetical protein IPG97_07970 [Microthrixaceae bacterium]|nr:hypothetical protein [Microthrixaceae bacterium]